MTRVFAIAHLLGGLLLVFAASYILPLAWSAIFPDGTLDSFLIAALSTAAIGLVLWFPTRRFRRELSARDGCLLVVFGWLATAASASVPLLRQIPGLSVTDAFFETSSALTTTGATILSGLDQLPESLNIWRHTLQWVGGMGIIILAVAIMPLLGVGGMQFFRADTPGPMKEGRLTPRITQTARNLYLIYVSLTGVCILCLRVAGMSWYEAICHAFSTLSLGGFSTRDASIMSFDSIAIEAVLAVFMLIAALSFVTHFLAVSRRSLRPYGRDTEALSVIVVLLGSCVVLAAFLFWRGVYPDFWTALRFAGFSAISFATTGGFFNADYSEWPVFVPIWMLFLCTIVASAGSTGGGIKMIRTIILVRQSGRELLRVIHPRVIRPLMVSRHVVEDRVIFSVLGYMLLYGVTAIALTLLMLATGLDLYTALSGVIACLNNTGPGLGLLGPMKTYQALSDFQTWLCTFAMIAGRLELLTVFVLLSPAFWRK